MMIDTGAQKTVIENQIPVQLGLTPTRFEYMVGVSNKAELCPVYPMELELGMSGDGKTGFIRCATEVIGMSSPAQPFQHVGLIGRDFLHGVKLTYDGKSGTFEIEVPTNMFPPLGQTTAMAPIATKPAPAKVIAAPAPQPIQSSNSNCHCGSGKKYKKCHKAADELAAQNKT
jgi:hypothetical protein